jgi:DNA-binding NtrC family response regulator
VRRGGGRTLDQLQRIAREGQETPTTIRTSQRSSRHAECTKVLSMAKQANKRAAAPEVVAIIDTSPDVLEMLSHALERAGFVAVTGFTFDIRDGNLDFDAFVKQHRPRVVVYDVAPPYERNFKLFQHVRSLGCAEGCRFVLTSTNAAHVQQLAGQDERVFEIIDKPKDLNLIVEAVRQAARARPTR